MCILVLWTATWNGFGRWERGKSAEVAYQRDVFSKNFLTHPSGPCWMDSLRFSSLLLSDCVGDLSAQAKLLTL